jgi:predicted ribosome quality control (RQC) complex YloA/Tae2 family protein
MSVTATEISRVVAELEGELRGAFLNKIVRSGPEEWVFVFRAGGTKLPLLVSLSSASGRIHLATHAPEAEVERGHFTDMLKKHILGARLASIAQIAGDRIVMMAFNTDHGLRSVAAEIMGSRGNMFVMDEHGAVMAVALDRKSRLSTGQAYAPPPAVTGKDFTAGQTAATAPGGDFAFNREMEKKFESSAATERLARFKAAALAPLRAEMKKTAKRQRDLAVEREGLLRHISYKRLGDILSANFASLKKGAPAIKAPDVYSPDGATVDIPLDPAKNPAENIQRYYKLYRKYEKGVPRIDAETEAMEKRVKELAGKITVIEKMEEVAEALKTFQPTAQAKQRVAGKKEEKGKPKFARRFISTDGIEIIVGRTDRENEEITFKVANGRDLWLHARDYPGSHVVARLPKNAEPSQATLRECAMLAIHYSKAAKAGKGEVAYCRAKDVTKPKGAPPGKVYIRGGKAMQVKVEPEKIKEMKERAELG